MKKFYIYCHIREDNNEIFYIGLGSKTKQDIKYNYYNRSIKRCNRNQFWYNITNKTTYTIKILFDNLAKEQAVIKEQRLIKLIGRRDLKLGSLVNLSNGGEGSVGYKHTDIWKSKASKRMIGNKIMNGKKHSLKTKLKISNNSYKKLVQYSIYQYSLDNQFIREWDSVNIVYEQLGILKTSLYNNLTGRSKSAGGFIWKKNN